MTTVDGNVTTISATIFDDGKERIVTIDGFDIEVALKGDMILFKNTDIPGVIGNVGTILGQNNVNISDFSLARNEKKEALAVILVDNEVTQKALDELNQLEACLAVNYVRL
jgi:D-3-phosphoglycerate dehydrogenase